MEVVAAEEAERGRRAEEAVRRSYRDIFGFFLLDLDFKPGLVLGTL